MMWVDLESTMVAAKRLQVAILLVLLLSANPSFGQVISSDSCAVSKDVAESQLREFIPKLQFLQQILDKNFSEAPPPPRVTAVHDEVKDAVTFSIDLDSQWASEFIVSHYAEVALVAPAVVTTIVPARQGDFFNYQASFVLSGSNFVANTRYFFSAISSRRVLNQQSRPSPVRFFDYLPQFALVKLDGVIASDSTPLPLDISFRNFEPSVVVTLVSPNGVAVNLTYQSAPDDGTVGRLSTIFVARVQIPVLTSGGIYTIRFALVRTGAVISRPLTVLEPFRPRFEVVFPSALPLAGGLVRVLLSRVIYPILLASTFVINSTNAIISTATLVESSPSGPQDFFVTFNLATSVSASSVVNYTIIPNGEIKASVQFSILYSAVRLLSVSPAFFADRPTNITVSFAVDSGTPTSIDLVLRRDTNTLSPITISNPFASDLRSALSLVRVAPGTFSTTLNFAGGRIVGQYAASLTVNFGSLSSATIIAPFEVRNPIPSTIAISPSLIFDDTEYSLVITVSNIGDIQASSNLVVTCGTATTCRCSVVQFAVSFASLNCAVLAAVSTVTITVNNTNIGGFGKHISASLQVAAATMPRLITTSSRLFTPLGRLPLAFAVTNFDAINVIRVAGVILPTSNYTLLRVVQPLDSQKLSALQAQVKSVYALEPGFSAAFDTVALDLMKITKDSIVCLLRMPRDANLSASSALVSVQQTSPSATVSFEVTFGPVLDVPLLRLSVSQISLAGGTPVVVNIRNYIPITSISDIDIVLMATNGNQTTETVLKLSLTQSLGVEAIVAFESPELLSTQDAQFKIVSKVDAVLGRTNATGAVIATPIVPFSLPVFDPRRIAIQSFNQRTLYSVGGPRRITFFVNFLKVLPVAVTVNLLDCEVVASPTPFQIRLEPDRSFAITVAVRDFAPSLTGNVDVVIFSGNEQANATLNVIAPPTSPVLSSQLGNDRIPSTSSTQRVTVSFRNFIASANTSNFFVYLDNGFSVAVRSSDVISDFTITTVSFLAPSIGSLSSSEPSRTIRAFVADLSSGCGRNSTCIGNFTLRYFNANLPSFVAMNPTAGAPSIVNSVVFVINNVQLRNASLLTAETTTTALRNNILISVFQASLAGPGLSAQSFITLQISWVTLPRPSADVSFTIRLNMVTQVLEIPTPFVFLPDNRPQLLSISPKSVSIDGGSHSCTFTQPAAYNFVSAKVFLDSVEVNSVIMLNGSVINFVSPPVAIPMIASVIFAFQGLQPFNISDAIVYNAPPPVVIRSIFPSELSSFGSSAQVTLQNIPQFWSLSSLRALLVSGPTSATCQVVAFTPSSATASINCPSLEVGFYILEVSDLSAINRVARSSSITVFNPLAPRVRSILPSQIFFSKSTQMSLVYEQYPIGSIPALFFVPVGSSIERDVQILSQFLEPSMTASTVCTFTVNSPVSVPSFSIKISVRNTLGTTFNTSSAVINTIDDSNAVVISVLPSFINSVGGLVEVRLGGYPSGILASDISVTLNVNDVSSTAAIQSFAYSDTSRVTLRVSFAAFDIATSSSFDIAIKPKGFDSKMVTFPLSVVKVSPSIISVLPSVVLDTGNEVVQVRIAYFPIITSSSQVSVSIGGFSGVLSASLSTSSADVTVISFTTARVSIPSPGNFSLLLRNILTPTSTLSSLLTIQVTEKVIFVPSSRQTVNSGTRALIPFTLFLPAVENVKFKDVGSTFNQDEQQVIVIPVTSNSQLGELVASGNQGYTITVLRKDVPYKGCITFAVSFATVIGSSGTQQFQIYYSEFIPTTSRFAPVLGVVSVDVVSRFIQLSPTAGAASGGYAVIITVSGFQSLANASIFFGNLPSVVSSQSVMVSSGTASASSSPVFLVSVISPNFPIISEVDVTLRINGITEVSAKFLVTLGCPDYVAFCGGLPGGYTANAPLISRSPPMDAVCVTSYCSLISSIPAPILLSFPRKQSTLVSTISFTVKSLFAASGSQIRVLYGSDSLLAVQSAIYSAVSDSFAVTVRSPAISEYRTSTIAVYSALLGMETNAVFLYTSVPPIIGRIRVLSVRPSSIPYEGTTVVSIDLANFPFTIGTPSNSVVLNASTSVTSFSIGPPSIFATLISSTDFGNATVQVAFRPSLFLNGTQLVNANLLMSAMTSAVSDSAAVTILINPRVPRRFSAAVAANAINTTSFRSIVSTFITLAAEGFSNPNVTVCFGWRDPVTRKLYDPNCAVDCVVVLNAIDPGSPVSFITVSYPRDYLATATFTFSPIYGELNIFIYDQIIPTTAATCLSKQITANLPQFECANCLTFHPADVPSLEGSAGTISNPVQVPYAVVRVNALFASELSFSFSNFYNPNAPTSTSAPAPAPALAPGTTPSPAITPVRAPVSSISAFVVTGDVPDVNAFPRAAPSCPLDCRISVLIGGRASDAKLVGKVVDVRFVANNSGTINTIVVRTKFVNPVADVVPSVVSSSGGALITVTSYAFSLLNITTTTFRASNSAFTILSGPTKVGSVGVSFVIQITTALNANDASFRIICNECQTNFFDEVQLEIYAALVLSSPPLAISACLNGDRSIQMLLNNLPTSLNRVDSFSVKFNKIDRPFVFVSDNIFNISFSCTEEFPSIVPLDVAVTLDGINRPATSMINLPALPIRAIVQGSNRFSKKTDGPFNVLIVVDTLLVSGQFAFDIVMSGREGVVSSPSVSIVRSDRASSLLRFLFDPRPTVYAPGLYNFVLTVRSQTSTMPFSVIDPSFSAICDFSRLFFPSIMVPSSPVPICAANAVTGGLFPIRVTQDGGFSFQPSDIVLSISRDDGSVVTSLAPSLRNFSLLKDPFFVAVNPHVETSDFSFGVFIARLSISSSIVPQARFLINVALHSDPRAVDVSFFDETLVSLSVSFNQPIAFSRSDNCSRMFGSETIARLGDGPRCIFRRTSILIVMGSGALIVVGDNVALLPNTVSPADGFPIFNPAQSLAVSQISPLFRAPDATISGTSFVEGCSSAAPARIDASLSSPRPSSVSWSCVGACGNSLPTFLATLSTPRVIIPSRFFKDCPDNVCSISATFKDFLDRIISTPGHTIVSNPLPAPQFDLILPFSERFTPATVISLKTRLVFSACVTSNNQASLPAYTWSLTGPTQINTTLFTGPFLNIRSNTLLPGAYTVTASVFIDGMTATEVRPMIITSRALFATIVAPRVASTSQNLTLDARNSKDLETTINPRISLVYTWSCFDQSGFPCVDRMNAPLVLNQSSVVVIPANTLPASSDNTTSVPYFFRLTVTNAVDSRVATAEVVVNVVADSVPSIFVTSSTDQVNAGSSVTLNAIVDDPTLTVTWFESSGLLENFAVVIDPAFTNRQKRIVINTASFVTGQTYVFLASVDSDRRASAAVSVTVNSPPSSGTCVVSSIVTGSRETTNCGLVDNCNIQTSVTVTCSNWNDKDLPLRYEYGYVSSTGESNRFDYVMAASQSFNLPIGNQTIFVNVCDRFFACTAVTRVNPNVLHILPVVLDAVAVQSLTNDVNNLVRSRDVEGFCAKLSSVSSYFASTSGNGNRRLLSTQQKLDSDAFFSRTAESIFKITSSLSSPGSSVDPGASGSLLRASSNLVSSIGEIKPEGNVITKLLPAMLTLSSALSIDATNVQKVALDARSIATAVGGLSGFDSISDGNSVNFASNFNGLRALENNMLTAVLLSKEPGQAESVRAPDGNYIARALKPILQDRNVQDFSISSPSLPSVGGAFASTGKFDLGISANIGANLNVRSSAQPKSKWGKLVTKDASLLSDLIDCTVYKDGVSLTQPADIGTVNIQLDFPLNAGTGAGSRDAFLRDKSSFKLMFVNPSTGSLSDSGCTAGTISEIPGNLMAARYTGSCNHLTVFGMVASLPSSVVPPGPIQPGPIQPGPVNPGIPSPTPTSAPVVATPPAESPSPFPVWASIVIAVGGAAVIALAAYLIKKRREKVASVRGKQIVASSLWKQSLSVSKPQDSPKPVYAAPASPPRDVVTPTWAASTSNASPPPSRRQLLADLVGAIALDESLGSAAPPPSLPSLPPTSLSRSPSPFQYKDGSNDAEFSSSLYRSSPTSLRDIQIPVSQSSARSLRLPEADFSPAPAPLAPSFSTFSKPSAVLPRRKSPYASPSASDARPVDSNLSSSRVSFESGLSESRLSDKSVRQQLADLAAAAAVSPSLPRSESPVTADFRAPRSASRGRIPDPDVNRSPVQDYTAQNLTSPSRVSQPARNSRQLMAEMAASAVIHDFEPRSRSPFTSPSATDAIRLPRSRSRPLLDDPDTAVLPSHAPAVPSRVPIDRLSPHRSRLSSSPSRSLPSRREASIGRGLPDPDVPVIAAPPPRRTPAAAGASGRGSISGSRQGAGSRFSQA